LFTGEERLTSTHSLFLPILSTTPAHLRVGHPIRTDLTTRTRSPTEKGLPKGHLLEREEERGAGCPAPLQMN